MANINDFVCGKDALVGNYDYVVVGTGLTASAFVHQLDRDVSDKNILVLEAGNWISDTHFQNIEPELASQQFEDAANRVTGVNFPDLVPYRTGFGGRTLFWTAWTPRPTNGELEDWPEGIVAGLSPWFTSAEDFLGSQSSGEVDRISLYEEAVTSIDTVGYDVIPSTIAKYDQRKFCAVDAWKRVCDKTPRNSLKFVFDTKISQVIYHDGLAAELVSNHGRIKLGGADLILCCGTLGNTLLAADAISSKRLRFGCHGVVSYSVSTQDAYSKEENLSVDSYLVRPRVCHGSHDHHFQISLAKLGSRCSSRELHKASPDALELSTGLFESSPNAKFACTITCLFDYSPVDAVSCELDFEALKQNGQLSLKDYDKFQIGLKKKFGELQQRTINFAHATIRPEIYESPTTKVEVRSKYIVHDTVIDDNQNASNIRDWRNVGGAKARNLYTLGSVAWPAVGVSNPAVLNVSSSFALANELAALS